MKKTLFFALAAAVMAAASIEGASAQAFQLGARVGLTSQSMDKTLGSYSDVKSRLGWHLTAVSRVRIVGAGSGIAGVGLFFQPEVVYSQNSIKATAASSSGGGTHKIKMKTVDVPLLLSVKVSVARVHAGPVFNLMNNFTSGDGKLEILPLRAPVGYSLGASVDLFGLTFDARYHGEFKKLSFEGGTFDGIKSSLSSWSIGVGIML